MRHLNIGALRMARWLLNLGVACLIASPIINIVFPVVPAILRYDSTKLSVSILDAPGDYTSAFSYTIPFGYPNWTYILGIVLILTSLALRLKGKFS